MKIGMIGVGYVGLVSGVGFANMGNSVICMDVDEQKINNLKQYISPIYEPGLTELLKLNIKNATLSFTNNIKETIEKSKILFIAVGTPSSNDGSADLKYVLSVASSIAEHINEYKTIVIKSTVPVGTCYKVKDKITHLLQKRNIKIDFDIVSNPEFLKEGHAIEDFMKPDRIIIGTENERAKKLMGKLYNPFTRITNNVIYMDIISSEMTKYAANAMLATKISFMNELARLCDKTGADIKNIRLGIGSDTRIGPHFIYSGLGYGGSCFPKDVKALINTGIKNKENMNILQSVLKVNQSQRKYFVNKITAHFGKKLNTLTIAIWGLSFKPDTDDIREAPAIDIISMLIEKKAKINAYDPISNKEMKKLFNNIQYYENQYQVLKEVDALCIITDWKIFREPNFEKIKTLMKRPVIFDGRNLYEPDEMKKLGFYYYAIGRNNCI